MPRRRVLHLTDRASARGGADWHLLGVIGELAGTHEQLLAVGRDDGTARPACPVEALRGLAASRRQSAAAALGALAARFEPEVIHVHNVMNPEVLEWAADRGAIMTVQDHRTFCPGRGKLTAQGTVCTSAMNLEQCAGCFDDEAYFRDVCARTLARQAAVRRMRGLTVLSHYVARELTAVGVAPERIAVIPPLLHGLDPSAQPSGGPCVLFAGRLVASKGIDAAVAAWRRAGVKEPLVVAGTGPDRQRVEAAGCEVLGWVPHHELSAVYRRALAVLMPSRWQEPFGIVGPEALSLGVPVLAWRSGGIAEWHPGGAQLVAWGDVEGLAAALADTVAHAAAAASRPTGTPHGPSTRELMHQLVRVYETSRD